MGMHWKTQIDMDLRSSYICIKRANFFYVWKIGVYKAFGNKTLKQPVKNLCWTSPVNDIPIDFERVLKIINFPTFY